VLFAACPEAGCKEERQELLLDDPITPRPQRRAVRLRYDFGGGTFLPSLRAFDRPMAIACLGFVTFFPLRPLLSWPFFIAFISVSTFFCAAGEYLRVDFFLVEDFFADEVFLALDVAMSFLHNGQMMESSRLLYAGSGGEQLVPQNGYVVSVMASVRLLILAVR
jgi:hypothetical protein